MKFTLLTKIKEISKAKSIVLLISLVYNFIWAIAKIFFGVFNYAYFFCVSGASSLLFAFIKKVYLKNYKSDDFSTRRGKSITISVLLIGSCLFFTFYMARLFFVSDTKEYGLITSIAIATFSFTELGFSIYKFVKANKSKDILSMSFKGCSLVSACFSIVLTQVALLSATKTPANNYNALTGVIFGFISMCIGIYLLVYSINKKEL